MNLPPGYTRALDKYSEEFPRGYVVGRFTIIGNCAVVLDDGEICIRVEDERGKRTWKTIRGLRMLRTQAENRARSAEVCGESDDDSSHPEGQVRDVGQAAGGAGK